MTGEYSFTYYVIMKSEGKEIEILTRRLDVVIALNMIATKDENTTLRDKIILLDGLGLKSGEIASVLNKKANYE